MPISVVASRATVFIRREAFERAGLARSLIDERFNLTDQEFRMEGDLIAVGPLPSDEMVGEMIAELESSGLRYFDEFFELSGNWPEWLKLYAAARQQSGPGV